MANVDAPMGFTPAYHLSGGIIRAREYRITSDGSISAIYTGDLVKLLADGSIAVAAAGDRVVGVFAGCRYTTTDGEAKWSPYLATNLDTQGDIAYGLVYDDPMIVFRAQSSGASGVADIGQLADMIATHSGSTSTGRSGQEINTTTAATTGQLRQLAFVDDPNNDSTADNAELYVQIYEHEYNEHVAGGAASASPGV